jgi:DNA polymerase type B, organellar and viral
VSDELTLVSYEALERGRRRHESESIRKARDRYKWAPDTRRAHHEDRRFVGWDGEGPRDAGYALFGNSDGEEICNPFLSTIDCLNLLIKHKQANPDTIDVWFGGDYDVSMILGDLPRRNMAALHSYSKTVWGEFQLEHIPHKWFKVRHGEITVTLFDIHSFFDSGYADALDSWQIGTTEDREAIAAGKKNRENFVWLDIEAIRDYFRLELQLMPLLCERLREVFEDAGYMPRSWHGPGALARMALRRHGVYAAMAQTPDDVCRAARSAFAGGRFELKYAGHFNQRIYNYDIHSAYPYFATFLPNLARGTWRYTDHYEPSKFAVYNIRYEAKEPDSYRLYPLFRRLANTGVAWPYRVTGWYWGPEAELVKDDSDATILGGWVFDEDDPTDRPFAWLLEYYNRRRILKNNGQAAEYTFKLIINAVYGQLAQRVGWNRKDGKPPRTHQLEWAGYITSACRAAVYKASTEAGEKLISIDTDGLYSLAPIESLDIGDNLGQWELAEYDDGVFWQSGVYCLRRGEDWIKAKARGIPKGTYTAQDLLDKVKSREPFKVYKNVFVGYGLADNGQWSKRNTWERKEHEYVFGGTGKRSHLGRFGGCNIHCNGDIHALGAVQLLYGPDGNPESEPHYLPWLDNELEATSIKEKGHFALSQEDPDSEEIGWMKESQHASRPPSVSGRLRLTGTISNVSAAEPGIRPQRKLASLFSRRIR